MKQTNAISRLKAAGLSRREIAEATGTTRACVAHWASGRSIPRATQMAALNKLASEHGVVLLASDFGVSPEARDVA